MILPVYLYGSPVLRRKASEISSDYKGLKEFISDMFETMYHSEGIGLAAPQVGRSDRIFIVDASPLESEEEPELKDLKKVFINPEIVSYEEDSSVYVEGCLSVPEIREEVERKSRIRIRYYDENFNFHDEYYEGYAARIIQHEYDHLQGRLFTDLISPIKRRLLRGKLNSISRGKVEVNYKVKTPR